MGKWLDNCTDEELLKILIEESRREQEREEWAQIQYRDYIRVRDLEVQKK